MALSKYPIIELELVFVLTNFEVTILTAKTSQIFIAFFAAYNFFLLPFSLCQNLNIITLWKKKKIFFSYQYVSVRAFFSEYLIALVIFMSIMNKNWFNEYYNISIVNLNSIGKKSYKLTLIFTKQWGKLYLILLFRLTRQLILL